VAKVFRRFTAGNNSAANSANGAGLGVYLKSDVWFMNFVQHWKDSPLTTHPDHVMLG